MKPAPPVTNTLGTRSLLEQIVVVIFVTRRLRVGCRIEPEEIADRVDNAQPPPVRGRGPESHGGTMKELVHQGSRQPFDDRAIRFAEVIELPQRGRELALAHTIHLTAEAGEHRYGGESSQPLPEPLDLAGDQLLGRRQLVTPALDIVRDDGAQIIEVVEKDVVDAGDVRFDVAWDRDVENAERTIATARYRRLHPVEGHHGSWRGGRAEQHVDLVQRCPALVVMHRKRAVPARELLRALVGPVRDDRGAHALIHQTLQRELGHLSGTENHCATSGERAEDLASQLQSGRAHRGGAATYGRFAADTAGDEKRALKEPIENRAALRPAGSPSVADLAYDLGLAEDHGVQPGCDAKEMRDGVAIAPHVAVAARFLAQPRRQSVPDRRHRVSVALDDVELRAVARREEHGLARTRIRTQGA